MFYTKLQNFLRKPVARATRVTGNQFDDMYIFYRAADLNADGDYIDSADSSVLDDVVIWKRIKLDQVDVTNYIII